MNETIVVREMFGDADPFRRREDQHVVPIVARMLSNTSVAVCFPSDLGGLVGRKLLLAVAIGSCTQSRSVPCGIQLFMFACRTFVSRGHLVAADIVARCSYMLL